MKKLTVVPLILLLAALFSCETIPDLNPNTNAGADITVYTLNDTVIQDTIYQDIYYDLNDDLIDDISFSFDPFNLYEVGYVIDVNGEILIKPRASVNIIPRVDALANNNTGYSFGSYTPYQANLYDGTCFRVSNLCLFERLTANFLPNGNKYLMIKLEIDYAFYYGWIEYFADFHIDGQENEGILVIKRIGIADEAGVVLRAGQIN